MTKIEKICDEEQRMMITELIGLGETQRRIYDSLKTQSEFQGNLKNAYEHHIKELELLIKYQEERNGD
jgi:hypothetical protein